jgi:type I restriction enzyme, R subunit
MTSSERQIEEQLLQRLRDLKYDHRADIRDRAALENNFRERFQALNKVELTDGEFQRLRDEIITPDVFSAAKILRGINSFTRDDGTPLNYTLVNIKDWCKNSFEIVSQLRINTDYSHHRYDVLLLINGVPAVQIELKTLGINPRRAMEQIVEYKNDPGNGYSRTLLCFVQLFVVSSRDNHAAKPRTVDPIAQLPLRNLAGPTLPGSPNRIGRWISHLPDDDWWL